ncbi:CHAP domain-containing protein [Kitasatospora sp. NBC_00070]|uniref:CHAP domain-containing protein n=1 Tax=Kitasatospora sp. NBC_00070 TaxID=2975962 RepID=UPI0032492D49
MNHRHLPGLVRRIAGATVATVVFALLNLANVTTASAATGTGAAALAAANLDKTAGTCANSPTHNSLGGAQFETSCSGGGSGGPEYWCADFVQWVWQNSGFSTGGLDADAASFYAYGRDNGTLHTSASYQPQPGDAVVYGSVNDTEIHHVAIVTSVNADGSITTANGDWGGTPGTGSMADFAVSSRVAAITLSAGQKSVGSVPGNVDTADGYTIVGYTTPTTTGSTNPNTPTAICGTGFKVIDSHALGGAVVYLLYNGSTARNCVTTVATDPGGKVAMDATLAAQGGSSAGNPGNFTYYAGPVILGAANVCVQWGGSYAGTSWTSGWSHCG